MNSSRFTIPQHELIISRIRYTTNYSRLPPAQQDCPFRCSRFYQGW